MWSKVYLFNAYNGVCGHFLPAIDPEADTVATSFTLPSTFGAFREDFVFSVIMERPFSKVKLISVRLIREGVSSVTVCHPRFG